MPSQAAIERSPLLIADGDIPTTRLVARELAAVHPHVETRIPDMLFGANVRARPVVVSRLCHPTMSWLPQYMAEQGASYAYFLDDNFWELTPDADPYLADFFNKPGVVDSLDAFVRGARRVIAWSPRLAQYVRDRFPTSDVVHVPAGFDVTLVPVAAAPSAGDGIFRVGYPTTRKLGLVPLLTQIVQRARAAFGDRVRFEFMGWMPDVLAQEPHVTLLPQVDDYAGYLATVVSRGWNVAIAPLLAGRFESYKTDIKYREYGGCGVPGLYSAVPPYVDSVADGRNGLLLPNEPDAWIAAFARLMDDPALCAALAAAARVDVVAHRDIRVTGARFAEAVEHER